jgi:hypothetical protein
MCHHQLVSFAWTQDKVVPLHEILPGEFRIPGLGGGGGQVKAQRVGIVLAQEVGYLYCGAAALAELAPSEVEVFSDTGCKIHLP